MHDGILGDGNNVTVIREATGITGVSSIAAQVIIGCILREIKKKDKL